MVITNRPITIFDIFDTSASLITSNAVFLPHYMELKFSLSVYNIELVAYTPVLIAEGPGPWIQCIHHWKSDATVLGLCEYLT